MFSIIELCQLKLMVPEYVIAQNKISSYKIKYDHTK